jgi:predicted amidohydrolase
MKKTRFVSVSFPGGGFGSVAANRDRMVAYVEEAAPYRPDFVCFTEVARELGVPKGSEDWMGEPIPGPTTEAIGAAAAKCGTHVVLGMQERAGEKTYNAGVLVGRDGEVVGVYHKYQPTISEMEEGVTPGTDAPTWETDHGCVGICICFDLKFPEVGMALARAGARIVFFPSMFHGGARQEAWARDYGTFLVASQSQESTVVDMCGRKLVGQGHGEHLVSQGQLPPFAFAEANTDCKAYHLDYNQDLMGPIQAQYGSGVRFTIMRREATFVLESMMDDTSVEEIEAVFGLEDLWTYYDRARGERQSRL